MLDISQLGMREYKRIVEDAEIIDGLSVRVKRTVTVRGTQPILTPEEAEVLKDEKWKAAIPDHHIYGNFVCMVNGRRFFCATDPSAEMEKPLENNDGQREKPARKVVARRSSTK